ncbi:hypothetical protein PRIPAC_81696 [Pristionchus pacificus]|uniref:Uncharacterized protein n=1 Tax=Pristionchus pacificus TaxID=54126 RepID=A0A2A6CMQ6_PRIPA|nr:hypothetical protein PRIPAC_81696 [Pristionchus pacificus]|eukprot:PDM79484.1 hypothetical protein PRIPAC_32063 [Pristionchus pacificus]
MLSKTHVLFIKLRPLLEMFLDDRSNSPDSPIEFVPSATLLPGYRKHRRSWIEFVGGIKRIASNELPLPLDEK